DTGPPPPRPISKCVPSGYVFVDGAFALWLLPSLMQRPYVTPHRRGDVPGAWPGRDRQIEKRRKGEKMSNRAEEDRSPSSDTEPVQTEVSYEELEEHIDRVRRSQQTGDVVDTKHTDGSTENPVLAQEQ